jgi:mannosyltransferase OCH1-like enzyme
MLSSTPGRIYEVKRVDKTEDALVLASQFLGKLFISSIVQHPPPSRTLFPIMKGLLRKQNTSLRGFLAGQMQQLFILIPLCLAICVSLNLLTDGPAELVIDSERFPRKIWQSWKVDPTQFESRDIERARTWTVKNPGHRYEVLTDDNADYYVEHHYGPRGINRPDIVNTYKSLNARIIKSDLLRYLIMYVEGGLYADIDVEAIRPIKRFIPKIYDEALVDMVIGIEVDEPSFAWHPVLGSKAQSFCQWTFMGKPRLPVMMRLIENIMKWLHDLSVKQGKPISELYLDFNEVLTGTGPSAFTIAILAEMSKVVGKPVRWETFTGLTEAKLVGGVLVLPVEAFAAGTGHSDSGNHKGKGAMVKHHFHASSWPSKHPRFKHPVYGEVEKCNWDLECVKLWDANIAFFDSLPEAQRLEIINIKEAKQSRPINPQIIDNVAKSPQDFGHHMQDQSPLHIPVKEEPEKLAGESPMLDSDTAEAAVPLALTLDSESSMFHPEEGSDMPIEGPSSDGLDDSAEAETGQSTHLETRDLQETVPLAVVGGLTPGLNLGLR